MTAEQLRPNTEDILGWCRSRLGYDVSTVLFESGYLSRVVGVRLDDGREVVVKARLWHPRLVACDVLQRAAYDDGFPCPEPFIAPEQLDGVAFSAEKPRPGGVQIDSADPAAAARSAELLARLVHVPLPDADLTQLAGTLAWVGWDVPTTGLWPARDDVGPPIEDHQGPTWLDNAARLAKVLLQNVDLPLVAGHGDWESQNMRWEADGTPRVVHDWDSVILQPEAAVAGAASAIWTADGTPGRAATVAESDAFLDAYQRVRGRGWTDEETRAAWAAGLWVRAFNAKKDAADGGGPNLDALAPEVAARMERAGLAEP